MKLTKLFFALFATLVVVAQNAPSSTDGPPVITSTPAPPKLTISNPKNIEIYDLVNLMIESVKSAPTEQINNKDGREYCLQIRNNECDLSTDQKFEECKVLLDRCWPKITQRGALTENEDNVPDAALVTREHIGIADIHGTEQERESALAKFTIAAASGGCHIVFTSDIKTIVANHNSFVNETTDLIADDQDAIERCGLALPTLHDVLLDAADSKSYDVRALGVSDGGRPSMTFKKIPFSYYYKVLAGKCDIKYDSNNLTAVICNRDDSKIGYILTDDAIHLKRSSGEHWFTPALIYRRYIAPMETFLHLKDGYERRSIGTLLPNRCEKINLRALSHGNHISAKLQCGKSTKIIRHDVSHKAICSSKYPNVFAASICDHYPLFRMLVTMVLVYLVANYLQDNIVSDIIEYILYIPATIFSYPLYRFVWSSVCVICGGLRIWKHRCQGPCGWCKTYISNGNHECNGIAKTREVINEMKGSLKARDGKYKVNVLVNPVNEVISRSMFILSVALLFSMLLPTAMAIHMECRNNSLVIKSNTYGSRVFSLPNYSKPLCDDMRERYLYKVFWDLCLPGESYHNILKMYNLGRPSNNAETLQQMELLYPYHKFINNAFSVSNNNGKPQSSIAVCDYMVAQMKESISSLKSKDVMKIEFGSQVPIVPSVEVAKEPEAATQQESYNSMLAIFTDGYTEPSSPAAMKPWHITTGDAQNQILDIMLPIAYGSSFSYQAITSEGSLPFIVDGHIRSSMISYGAKYEYTTCNLYGGEVYSTYTCVSPCGTCMEQLKKGNIDLVNNPNEYLFYEWRDVNNWECEGKGCWTINTGCLCAACKSNKGSNCMDVKSVASLRPSFELCLRINGKGGCRKIESDVSSSDSDLQIYTQMNTEHSPFYAGEYFAEDPATGNVYVGQIARRSSEEKLFGQPQYDIDGRLLKKIDERQFTKECKTQDNFKVTVQACYTSTYDLKSQLQQVSTRKAYNLMSLDTSVGDLKLSIRIPPGKYKWLEKTAKVQTSIQRYKRCPTCGNLDEMEVLYSSDSEASLHMTCENFTPVSPVVSVMKGTKTLRILGDGTGDDVKCEFIGKDLHKISDAKMSKRQFTVEISNERNITKLSVVKQVTITGSPSLGLPEWLGFPFLHTLTSLFYRGSGYVMWMLIAIVSLIAVYYLTMILTMISSLPTKKSKQA